MVVKMKTAAAGQANRSRQPLVAGQRLAPTSCGAAIASSISIRASPHRANADDLIFLQAASQQNANGGGVRGQRRPVRLSSHHGSQNVGYIFAVKRLLPGQQFIEHATERPNVGALVHRFARAPAPDSCKPPFPGSLPASSRPCSALASCSGSLVCCVTRECFRQAKVQHFDFSLGRHLHVGGFQVAVNDSFLVRCFQRLGNLFRDGRASSTGTAPSRLMRSANVSPDTNSITR